VAAIIFQLSLRVFGKLSISISNLPPNDKRSQAAILIGCVQQKKQLSKRLVLIGLYF